VVRQLLTESLMLASARRSIGGLVCDLGQAGADASALERAGQIFTAPGLNWSVLGVTAALSVVCGLLFGLAPAIQSDASGCDAPH